MARWTRAAAAEPGYPESETLDLDLFLHLPNDTPDWYVDLPPRPLPLPEASCGWHNCEPVVRLATHPVTGETVQRADWGYPDSPLARCENGPLGDLWRDSVGVCPNPRLDIDNNLGPGRIGLPENINVDQPRDGERFRIMVRNSSGGLSAPVVNVYCGGERVATFGAAPDTVPDFTGPAGGAAIGALWHVADVTSRVDASGVTTACEVEQLHPQGSTDGFRVTLNDGRFWRSATTSEPNLLSCGEAVHPRRATPPPMTSSSDSGTSPILYVVGGVVLLGMLATCCVSAAAGGIFWQAQRQYAVMDEVSRSAEEQQRQAEATAAEQAPQTPFGAAVVDLSPPPSLFLRPRRNPDRRVRHIEATVTQSAGSIGVSPGDRCSFDVQVLARRGRPGYWCRTFAQCNGVRLFGQEVPRRNGYFGCELYDGPFGVAGEDLEPTETATGDPMFQIDTRQSTFMAADNDRGRHGTPYRVTARIDSVTPR